MTEVRKKELELRNRIFILVAALLFFMLVVSTWANLHEAPPKDSPVFAHDGLQIEVANGKRIPYAIEVATTPEQEQYGLMFRHSLLADTGMIFIYKPDQQVSMWMKNTYIPLDMLYVRGDGTISKIVTHAEPMDLTPLSSEEPVRAVIEINAGEVAANGIKVGDKVLYQAFSDRK